MARVRANQQQTQCAPCGIGTDGGEGWTSHDVPPQEYEQEDSQVRVYGGSSKGFSLMAMIICAVVAFIAGYFAAKTDALGHLMSMFGKKDAAQG